MKSSNARSYAIKLARQLGLKVRLVRYLPQTILGKILPREKRILVNARTPVCEQVFTILHECGHYLLHVQRRVARAYQARLFDRMEAVGWLEGLAFKFRRVVRFSFKKEKEADMWAMCAFVAIAPKDGRALMTAFLENHPEKFRLFLLATASTFYCNWKKRLSNLFTPV